MQQMMSQLQQSPAIQNMMANPDMLRAMLQNNPMVQQVRSHASGAHAWLGSLLAHVPGHRAGVLACLVQARQAWALGACCGPAPPAA